jgi:hypothetical protein
MILRELIQRAVEIAIKDMPGLDRTSLAIAAEPLVPIAFAAVGVELARSSSTRHLLRRTKDLAVVDGTVALPDDVLTEYACEASLFDPADLSKLYSRSEWPDLLSAQLDGRLGHFVIDGALLTVVEPDQQYAVGEGVSADLKLIISCTPEVPGLDAAVAVPEEIIDLLVQRLGQSLRPLTVK